MRVIDALLLPEVQAGEKWVALLTAAPIVLVVQTFRFDHTGMVWVTDGAPVTLGYRQLFGPCEVIDPEYFKSRGQA